MSTDETKAPTGVGLVPDKPGWWWRVVGRDLAWPFRVFAHRRTTPFSHDPGPPVWLYHDGFDRKVDDDGTWRGPCLSLADIEAARTEGARVERERWAERLESYAAGYRSIGTEPRAADALDTVAEEMREVKP